MVLYTIITSHIYTRTRVPIKPHNNTNDAKSNSSNSLFKEDDYIDETHNNNIVRNIL